MLSYSIFASYIWVVSGTADGKTYETAGSASNCFNCKGQFSHADLYNVIIPNIIAGIDINDPSLYDPNDPEHDMLKRCENRAAGITITFFDVRPL